MVGPCRKAVPPGPDNPLGEYAMRLGIPGGAYLIHGTNRPAGVGMQVTHGCIRMYPEDIEQFFKIVAGQHAGAHRSISPTRWAGRAMSSTSKCTRRWKAGRDAESAQPDEDHATAGRQPRRIARS